MSSKEILEKALKLKPVERFMLVEGLIKSLDEPDSAIDEIWAEEAVRRLEAYRAGNLEGIPMEEIFNEASLFHYSIEKNHIFIIAIAHQHRMPDYWTKNIGMMSTLAD